MGFPVWRPTQDVRHQDLSFVSDVPFFEGDHVTFAMFQSCIDVAAPFRSDAGTEDSHIFDRDRVKILTITAACAVKRHCLMRQGRSEEHTSELQSLMRISYAVFCLKKKKITITIHTTEEKIYKHHVTTKVSII